MCLHSDLDYLDYLDDRSVQANGHQPMHILPSHIPQLVINAVVNSSYV